MKIQLLRENYTEGDIVAANPELSAGGMWRPKHCMARHKVAVIIPYRDREEHLSLLLYHLHPMLRKQQLDYTVIVVEQVRTALFQSICIDEFNFQKLLSSWNKKELIPSTDLRFIFFKLQTCSSFCSGKSRPNCH